MSKKKLSALELKMKKMATLAMAKFACKPTSANSGHIATFSGDGNLQDSGKSISDLQAVMGASGTNHKSGLVPDTPSTAGTSKYLREDGTWAEPDSVPANAVLFSSDSGEGVVPSDGIKAETVSAGATISVNPDVVTVVRGNVGTATITLQVPNDNLAHVWDILMTTDSSVSITIATSSSATIKVPSGFAVGTSKSCEIRVVGVGSIFYLSYGEFA